MGLESYITQSQTVQKIYEVSGSNIKVIGIIEVSVKFGMLCVLIQLQLLSQKQEILFWKETLGVNSSKQFLTGKKNEIILDRKNIKELDIKNQE